MSAKRRSLVACRLLRLEDRVTPNTYTPTVTGDLTFTSVNSANGVITGGTGNGQVTLRSAIIAANAHAGADIISIPAGTYTLSLTGSEPTFDNAAVNDLDTTESVTINGPVAGPSSCVIQAGTVASTNGIDGNGIDKVLEINPDGVAGVHTTITNVTIQNGKNTQPRNSGDDLGGGIAWYGSIVGGDVGSLTLTNCNITNNLTANNIGGGLSVDTGPNPDTITQTHVTITTCTISNNRCAVSGAVSGSPPGGGGIALRGTTTNANITGSFISGNVAGLTQTSVGGGIQIAVNSTSTIGIHNTQITNNTATGQGGGVYVASTNSGTPVNVTIDQGCVISGNTSQGTGGAGTAQGGGVYSSIVGAGTTTLTGITVTGNTASGASGQGGGVFDSGGPLTISFCRIVNNIAAGGGSAAAKDSNSGTLTATNNWWGTSLNPTTVTGLLSGTLTSSPFLQLKTTASPTSLVVNQASTLTTSFNTNSAGTDVSANIGVLLGLSVSWSGVGGAISGAQTTIQTSGAGKGTATATYTATAAQASNSATAVVDNGPSSGSTNTASITVAKANTATTITADTPDPSVIGQSVTVTFTVTPTNTTNSPTAITGNVMVTDGVNSATGTVSAGQAIITLNTVGNRTLTATYQGDSNFNASAPSAGVAHVVNKATVSDTATVKWGTAGTVAVSTAADMLRLLPTGRTTSLPWLGVNRLLITLNGAEPLAPADVSVTGSTVANYGPVTIAGSGTASITITLAQPINAVDRVTVTIGNASIATFTRRLDVLPADVNDDGLVNTTDLATMRGQFGPVSATNQASDLNGDNTVDMTDFNVGRPFIGTALPGPLFAASGGIQAEKPLPTPTSLTAKDLAPILAESILRREATGLTSDQITALKSVNAQIVDLPSGYLGQTLLTSTTIYVDATADGFGWFVDPTPYDDVEFPKAATATHLYSQSNLAPAGRMDLLTTVMHELGHVLGMDSKFGAADRDGVMYAYLSTGERRLPEANGRTAAFGGPFTTSAPSQTPLGTERQDATAWWLTPIELRKSKRRDLYVIAFDGVDLS